MLLGARYALSNRTKPKRVADLQKLPKNLPRSLRFRVLKTVRDQNWWAMTTSPMVIARGRVSMNITTLATSLASNRLPDFFASFNFSSGQSVRSALLTLRDRLRAGDIWVEGSRAFNDFLLPPAAFAWPSEKLMSWGLAVPGRFEAWRDERLEALKRALRDLAKIRALYVSLPTWLAISGSLFLRISQDRRLQAARLVDHALHERQSSKVRRWAVGSCLS
jgi:hypothetical protein